MRISLLFEKLKKQGRPALIGYITAGDPSVEATPRIVAALERGGVDLIELGVPFSDPIADGPVIQSGSERALRAGTTLPLVLEIAEQIRLRSQIPLLLFSYLNPVLRYGLEPLARDAQRAGIDGVLLTDLTVEEAGGIVPIFRKAGLNTVFLGSPTSTGRRLELVAQNSTGFVYLISRTGITGERDKLSDQLHELVARFRQTTSLPLAVGFGISTPEQAAEVGRIADGVVVGSAFVRIIEQSRGGPELEPRLEEYARSLARAIEGVKA